jgi:hypothetical protein
MTLSLACPQCGDEFASAIQMDAKTWATIKLENNIERWPNCGFSSANRSLTASSPNKAIRFSAGRVEPAVRHCWCSATFVREPSGSCHTRT